MQTPSIVVIIAAYNASATLAKAVQSALAEPEVSEVVVVDDASSDSTVSVAHETGKGDPRLRVLEQAKNAGPSAARNRAIAESTAPYIAILDADDVVLPGRFARMLMHADWDFIADNIIFCRDFDELDQGMSDQSLTGQSTRLGLEQFVLGNISLRRRERGELGFLKPVMRREFLETHAMHYDESCRFGEDFIFYTQGLAHGARFYVQGDCGYGALVRRDSLSSGHSQTDLEILHDLCERLVETLPLSDSEKHALGLHCASIQRRIDHRHVLSVKQTKGLLPGIMAALAHPTSIVDILRDRKAKRSAPEVTPRHLLTAQDLTANRT